MISLLKLKFTGVKIFNVTGSMDATSLGLSQLKSLTKTYTNLATETALGLTEAQVMGMRFIAINGKFDTYTATGIAYYNPKYNKFSVGHYQDSSHVQIVIYVIPNGFDLHIEDVWKSGGSGVWTGSFTGSMTFYYIE